MKCRFELNSSFAARLGEDEGMSETEILITARGQICRGASRCMSSCTNQRLALAARNYSAHITVHFISSVFGAVATRLQPM